MARDPCGSWRNLISAPDGTPDGACLAAVNGLDVWEREGTHDRNAAHIAGVHPPAVLALVALVRRERAIAAAERALREVLVMDGPRDEACGCENCADYGAAEDALRALGVEP